MGEKKNIQLQYFNGKEWVNCGEPWYFEKLAWLSLNGDDKNYRTINNTTGIVLTDKSEQK